MTEEERQEEIKGTIFISPSYTLHFVHRGSGIVVVRYQA